MGSKKYEPPKLEYLGDIHNGRRARIVEDLFGYIKDLIVWLWLKVRGRV